MKPIPLLTTLLLAIAVAANPPVGQNSPVSLPISKRFNITSASDLLRHNQLRVKALRAKGEAKAAGTVLPRDGISTPANNQALNYIVSIGVGSPATFYDVMVDSGSSNTWVGAGKAYVQTSTSSKTPNTVSVQYGSGSFNGTEFIDQVTIGRGLVIPKQSIGVASSVQGITSVDGLIGVGPVDLTAGTLSPDKGPVPTVTDNLFSDHSITANQLSISFQPITNASGTELNGELIWGGIDSSKFTGEITFTPITTTPPASQFWGINQSVKYGDTTLLSNAAGVADTGSPFILLATDAFKAYQSATGGVPDNNTGLLSITSAQFQNLRTLSFIIGGKSFDLIPNAQIWPRNLNTVLGGTADGIYLIVSDLGSPSGSGFDFANGQPFFERFYTVFDTANKRIGFATTPFTTATTN